MKLLSLFDDVGVVGLAMQETLGDFEYYTVGVDPMLTNFTREKFPGIRDIRDVKNLDPIDYLICGSPYQDISIVGKRKGLNGYRSSLFWEALRIKNKTDPTWWVFESIVEDKKILDTISEALEVPHIIINSRYWTLQNKLRCYWTNIPVVHPNNAGYIERVDHHWGYRVTASGSHRFSSYIPTLTRSIKTNAWQKYPLPYDYFQDFEYTPMTWVDFENAQGLPPGYTDSIRKCKRRLALANCLTLPVIKYIISHSLG
ncbi:MAG: DNA cytosine methyltransferase [Trichormus sp. ATA11-4-KO1]|jgi:hypothetical protein|nr:DNA cytosine methyltransferase [Trichormus sp. ATA11-4-KO1]